MFNTVEILEEFCKKGKYNLKKIEVINEEILSTGKDFLLMNSIVISVANNGWVASIYPDLQRIPSEKWVLFSWNMTLLDKGYKQVKTKNNKLVVQTGEIETSLLLLEFISLMHHPVENREYKNYLFSCNMTKQLGWGKILNYPIYPHNTDSGLELYSIYGPIIFKDTKYVPIKLITSNIYYFPDAQDYLTENEIKEIQEDKYVLIDEKGIKIVVEDEKYRHIDIIIKSLLKVIGIRYRKNWNIINSSELKKDPLYSLKISSVSHLMPDYSDIHTMRNNTGALQYKKTHTGGNNG